MPINTSESKKAHRSPSGNLKAEREKRFLEFATFTLLFLSFLFGGGGVINLILDLRKPGVIPVVGSGNKLTLTPALYASLFPTYTSYPTYTPNPQNDPFVIQIYINERTVSTSFPYSATLDPTIEPIITPTITPPPSIRVLAVVRGETVTILAENFQLGDTVGIFIRSVDNLDKVGTLVGRQVIDTKSYFAETYPIPVSLAYLADLEVRIESEITGQITHAPFRNFPYVIPITGGSPSPTTIPTSNPPIFDFTNSQQDGILMIAIGCVGFILSLLIWILRNLLYGDL